MIIYLLRNEVSANEHLDPNSYSWSIMRYAVVKYIHHTMTTFLPEVGIEVAGNELLCVANKYLSSLFIVQTMIFV